MLWGPADPFFMFNIGRPEDTARLYWDRAEAVQGPELNTAPLDEQSWEDLRNSLNYTRIALDYAVYDDADQEVLDILAEQFEEVFKALIPVDEEFAERVRIERFVPPIGTRPWWKDLAAKVLSES